MGMCLNDYYTSSLNDDFNLFLANVAFQKKFVAKEKNTYLNGIQNKNFVYLSIYLNKTFDYINKEQK